ncbi:unnamed protein product [Protopolystoma xenopodis]|uniref:Uncharacterized protein n=1 Tax=Protopolystoma xenopodis TaxID=117903 RepID=A0A3S5ACF2_9PLAT|nr:unnamed protein product [Protopolystoma xenopodis]
MMDESSARFHLERGKMSLRLRQPKRRSKAKRLYNNRNQPSSSACTPAEYKRRRLENHLIFGSSAASSKASSSVTGSVPSNNKDLSSARSSSLPAASPVSPQSQEPRQRHYLHTHPSTSPAPMEIHLQSALRTKLISLNMERRAAAFEPKAPRANHLAPGSLRTDGTSGVYLRSIMDPESDKLLTGSAVNLAESSSGSLPSMHSEHKTSSELFQHASTSLVGYADTDTSSDNDSCKD